MSLHVVRFLEVMFQACRILSLSFSEMLDVAVTLASGPREYSSHGNTEDVVDP